MDCLFCKIINREVGTTFVFENDKAVAFDDINPKAPVHILIVPKKHIASVADLTEDDREIAGEVILSAREIANKKGLEGYKLVFNVGRGGGQLIDHLHLHLLGGEGIEMP